MSRNERMADRRRRSTLGVGTAAGAAFAAALISMGTAPVAGADDDPFFDLFGDQGFNASWTDQADSLLPTSLAGPLDASVESFQTAITTANDPPDPFTDLTLQFDPTAFTVDPDHDTGGVPITYVGDLAVGMDYLLSLTPGADQSIDGLFDTLFQGVGGLP